MPAAPYWRMMVLDVYENAVSSLDTGAAGRRTNRHLVNGRGT